MRRAGGVGAFEGYGRLADAGHEKTAAAGAGRFERVYAWGLVYAHAAARFPRLNRRAAPRPKPGCPGQRERLRLRVRDPLGPAPICSRGGGASDLTSM